MTQPFSDEELLANGFEQAKTIFRKQVNTSDAPSLASPSLLEPTTLPPFTPRGGYHLTEPPLSPRAVLLREAEELITGDRNTTYGPPTQNFKDVAALWNAQFGHLLKDDARLTSAHVAQAMSLVKLARMIAQPSRDSYLDLAGYAACGWECEEAGE